MSKKLIYALGIVTLTSVLVLVVLKLFVFSSPPEVSDDDDRYYKKMHENYIIYSPFIPEEMDFCDEKVPLDRFDVYESLDYEFLKIIYWHSETILYIKRMHKFFPIVEPILKKHGIPDDFKYLMVTESGMVNVVSPANAAGYWQFLKGTAREYGLEVNSEVDERYNIEKSTIAACKYFLNSYKIFGSWSLVAASYNAGIRRIKEELKEQKVESFYDLLLYRETTRYLYRILAFKQILSHPRKYGFNIRKKDCYQSPETKILEVDTSINSLVNFAIEKGTNYRVLKKLNPWLRSDKLTNSAGKTYYIKIPK